MDFLHQPNLGIPPPTWHTNSPKVSSCQQHASKPCDCKRFPSSSKALQGATFPLECLLVGSIEVRMVIDFFRQVKMTQFLKRMFDTIHHPESLHKICFPHSSLVQIKVTRVASSNPNRLPEDLLKSPQWKGLDASEWASLSAKASSPPRKGREARNINGMPQQHLLKSQVCLPIPLHWVFHSSNGRTAGGSQGIISAQERWRTMPTIL